jgi:hypothetical protein
VDDHAKRVCQPLIDAWGDLNRGEATLLDLSRLAEQASTALDNASALPQLLAGAAGDLDYAYYATAAAEHEEAAHCILASAFAAMDRQL